MSRTSHLSVLLLALAASLPASAAETCPWANGEPLDVRITMTEVRVNEIVYDVQGADRRAAFADELTTCGFDALIPEFERWRKARRTANAGAITIAASGHVGVIGALATLPVGLGIVIGGAADAGIHKARLRRGLDGAIIDQTADGVVVTAPDHPSPVERVAAN